MIGLVALALAGGPEAPLTPAQQVEDFDRLWRDLEHYHPSLTLYADPEGLQRVRDGVRARLGTVRTRLELWGLLMESMAPIGCGHTGVSFGTDEIREPVLASAMFPLDLVVVDGGLYADPRVDQPQGRLVSANGMEGTELLARLRALQGGDGRSTASADARIDRWPQLVATAVLGPREHHEVVLERDGVQRTERLPGTNRFIGVGGTEPRTDEERRHDVTLLDLQTGAQHHPRDGVEGRAVLATFDEFPRRARFRRHVVRPVVRLLERGASALIVDLRWNGGGDPFAAMELYGHLIPSSEPSYSLKAMKADVWDELGWWKDGTPTADGLMDAGYGRYDTIQPREPRYDGPVVILTSGDSFSTAADFAAFGKRRGRATIIGEPTGGSATIQTSGATWEERLPHSGIAYHIPLTRSVLADPDGTLSASVGVQPDIQVSATLEDLAAGRDVGLAAALAFLRSTAR